MTTSPNARSADRSARQAYLPEFKIAAVYRVKTGEPVAAVARDIGVARNTLKAWVRSAADDQPADQDRPPSGIVEAAANGSRRDVLVALRTEIAGRIGDVAARDLPAHARLLNDIVKELEDIDEKARADAEDDSNLPDEPWDESQI